MAQSEPRPTDSEGFEETVAAISFFYLVVQLLPGGEPQTRGHAHAGFMLFSDAVEWVASQPGSPYIVIDAITGKIVPGQ